MKPLLFFRLFFVILGCLVWSVMASAYPVAEKVPATGSAPLAILSAQPEKILVPTLGDYKDKYLFVVSGSDSDLTIVDLETWGEYHNQPDAFSSTVVDVAMLSNGTSVVVALSDGDLARLELDDEDTFANTVSVSDDSTSSDEDDDVAEESTENTDSRQVDLVALMTSPGITHMVADPDDEIVYMVNDNSYLLTYNFFTNELTEVLLECTDCLTDEDDDGVEETSSTTLTPTGMVMAASSGGDKILITTNEGRVVVMTPGSTSYSVVALSSSAVSTEVPALSKISLTPDHDFAYIVDTDNDVLWGFSVTAEVFLDQQTGSTSFDPLEVDSDFNSSFSNVFLYEDLAGDIVGYASGGEGVTLFDAAEPDTASDEKVIDADAATDSDVDQDPIVLSGTPGPMAATSADAGYVFSANGDASISVLTDNPWVTISSISADTITTASSSTFTVTFQSDTPGSYSIRANSNPAGDAGTELLASTAFTDVDTDLTTAEIDISGFERSTFVEGTNKICVFVDGTNELLGHSAVLLTVDRPPEALIINGTNFGNQKVFVYIAPSPDEDINHYDFYAEPAENQASPACPGGLTFAAGDVVSVSLDASTCTSSSAQCEGKVTGLTNDVYYCVAATVTDQSEQESDIASYTTAVRAEQTVGPAGWLGETGCSLYTGPGESSGGWLWGVIGFLLLGLTKWAAGSSSRAHELTSSRGDKFTGGQTHGLDLAGWAKFPVVSSCARELMCSVSTRALVSSCALAFVLLFPLKSLAQELTPQNWTFEARIASWFPSDSAVRGIIGTFPHFEGEFEFGYLFKDRLNVTGTVGFGLETGKAVGIRSGQVSGDSYLLFLIPARVDVLYRFDYKSEQLFLPFVRAGFDAVTIHETAGGAALTNVKYGLHGGAGLGILLDRIEQMGYDLEKVIGVNDVYLVIEARYALINSFKSVGFDLSGFYPSVGVLFEF